ncbi:ABC transporter substrate-binding protein [Anaeromicropila populeti]|uniref:Peptide/nickel transport system substrate-binding protein n=1 Tax=Anaeromicropila populeti TaxID=37658 RepID=A0A1I6HJI6_9FIRM|nr:ABC transporter substrate-binding protein [Anaeromicropila populeti]SFR54635.1 peptide/nickel transport system substrate-binding protein [Anaeromicropila populeti]
MKKVLAFFLLTVMLISTLSGCRQEKVKEALSNAAKGSEEVNSTEIEEKEQLPLVVGYGEFDERFHPFFAESQEDIEAEGFTQEKLLTIDRAGSVIYHGIEGETKSFCGKEYTYKGIADFDVNYDQAADFTTYHIKIRDDVKFSDGKPLTTDDIIFSLYVLSDSSYEGARDVQLDAVVGMKNYRYNSTLAEEITDKEISEYIEKMSPEFAAVISEELIAPKLREVFEWCASLYEKVEWSEYTQLYPETKDLFAYFYSIDEAYDSKNVEDEEQVITDIISMYEEDYKTLGTKYADDEEYFKAEVRELAQNCILQEKNAEGVGQEVSNIEGITRISDTELEVKTRGYDDTTIYQFNFEIAPLHYYGNKSSYNYEKNQFGFKRGDLSAVKKKMSQPMGAGPYKFVKYENNTVYLERNETYYKGQPKISKVELKETIEEERIGSVEQGSLDIASIDPDKDKFEWVETMDKIVTEKVDCLGYGYIGINAQKVNVGNDADSDASKNLRKALATILSVYRENAVDMYFGEAARIIQYPMPSWSVPEETETEYKEAYGIDSEGNEIYSKSMTLATRYRVALEAALGYFEAAGYTVQDGKLLAAPWGASLQYEVMVTGNGKQEHPVYNVLADAAKALEEIGFYLKINDVETGSQMWNALELGEQELWVAAWETEAVPELYKAYHSDNLPGEGGLNTNYYGLEDGSLDELMISAKHTTDDSERKLLYRQCYEAILDWAVEVPVYQKQKEILFNATHINIATLLPDSTIYYPWMSEIEAMELNESV